MLALPKILQNLTAEQLPVLRLDRYEGNEFGIRLADLHPDDRSLLREVYQVVREIYDVRLYVGNTPDYDIFQELLAVSTPQLHRVRQLGQASLEESREANLNVSQALHDVRAGALSALVGYLDMHAEESLTFTPDTIERCVGLARDHAKLMRNCIEDLDPWIRRADERVSLHSVQADLSKWGQTVFHGPSRMIRVDCHDRCQGHVSNRCLETSSIDRILFNLMNNAARFCSSPAIDLQVDSLGNRLSRWVVSNEVSAEHQEWLTAQYQDLSDLFLGGTTRDGHGLGMNNCARLVQFSFGLGDVKQVLQKRYVGASLEGSTFYAWFHWPLYHAKEGDPICDCSETEWIS